MVCKELDELCAKFRSLSPHLRIDYIYGMLRMCLPPELRFIGSVVEDLAKKDFNHLREHENKANNQMELMKYKMVDEKMLIEGMAFNLSLLHSVNTACANIIFSLLKEKSKTAFHITNTTDSKTIDIILLVLTMAKYHPAFTFHQRSEFAEFYRTVEQQLHNICSKSNIHTTTSSACSSNPAQQHMTFAKVNSLPHSPLHSPQEMDQNRLGEAVSCLPVAHVQPYTESEYRQQLGSPDSSGNVSLSNSRSSSPDTELTLQNSPQNSKMTEPLKVQQSPVMTIDEGKDTKITDSRVSVNTEEKPREKGHDRLPNGVIEHPPYMCHQMYLHPPPQPMYHMGVPYQFQGPASVIASREASSSGNSSPSYSPVPQKKPPNRGGESSSDDSEKGGNVEYPDVRKKVIVVSQGLEDEVDDVPPPQRSALDNISGCSNNSGYQSDPTPTQNVRFYLANNAFKAPPTRGNGFLANKSLVNMPDVVAGRHFTYGYPIVRHDILTTTVASTASQHGQRPITYALNPASIRSPPVNSTGHNTFMCSVTSSTHSVMATNQQNGINANKLRNNMSSAASEPTMSNIQRIDSRGEIASSTSSPVSNGNLGSEVNSPVGYNQAQCTTCGCTGRHQMPTYPYPQVPNHYLPNHMMVPHYMNGMVPQPFYHQFQYPINGIPPNYLPSLSHHYPLSNFTTPQYGFQHMVVQRRNSASHNISKPPRTSSATCSNCGSTEHMSTDCRENSMESMSAAFQLKYDPKANSD